MNTPTRVIVDKHIYDELVKSAEELKKIRESASDQIYLIDHMRAISWGTSHATISVISKDEAFSLMKQQVDESLNKAMAANAAILSIKQKEIPFINIKARTVADLCKK